MPRPSEWVIKDCGSELSARALQVAISGFVADDDPTIIADLVQEIERLRVALRECGAPWSSSPGTVMSAAAELSDEFKRRMQIAADALEALTP